MARLATTRSVRGRSLVALSFVAACTCALPQFIMLGGSVQRATTPPRTTSHALAAVSAPGSDAMKDIFYKIAKVERRLEGRAWLASPSQQELEDYDQKMSADIQMLEGLIQDSIAVGTTSEVEWLENALQTVGQLKERFARYRPADAAAAAPMFVNVVVVGVFLLFLAGAATFENIEQTRNLTQTQQTRTVSHHSPFSRWRVAKQEETTTLRGVQNATPMRKLTF